MASRPRALDYPSGTWTAYPTSNRVELRTNMGGRTMMASASVCIKVEDLRQSPIKNTKFKALKLRADDCIRITFGANGRFQLGLQDLDYMTQAILEAKKYLFEKYEEKYGIHGTRIP